MRHEANSSNGFPRRPLVSSGAATLVLAAALSACGGGEPDAPPAIEARPAAVDDTARPIHRFAKTSNGAYFYTGDEAEKEIILRDMRGEMRYEGIAFMHSGGVPVYRFANLGNGGYFYTANPAERDLVQRTRPDMRYEGSSFSVAEPGADGAQQVWRLANLRNGAYLYTASQDEAKAAAALGFWRDEGPAFQALPLAAAPRATAMGCFNAAYWSPNVKMSRVVDTYVNRNGTFVPNGRGELLTEMRSELAASPGGEIALVKESPSGSNTDRIELDYLRVEHGDVTWIGYLAPDTRSTSRFALQTATITPGVTELFFTAPPGTTVSRTGSVKVNFLWDSATGTGTVARSVTFLGFEEIRVTAGTFKDACRFRVVNDSSTFDRWFAQGSGIEIRTENSFQRHDLVSVRVNGKLVKP